MIIDSELRLTNLKHLAWIEMGQSPSSKSYTYNFGQGLPFLQGAAEFGKENPTPRVFSNEANKLAKEGDILVSVRAPVGALNIADRAYGIGLGLCAVHCEEELDKRFAWWALHWATAQLALEATGSTYDAVAAEDVGNLLLPTYRLFEQKAIANYLDRETEKLDALIESMQRLLTVLAEKRQAVITHALTRGLNPDAPMRDSGVAWIGEIPTHWDVELARWLLEEIDERSEIGTEELLTVSHLTGVTPRSEKDVNMFMAESMKGYKICRAGDLVINTLWAWMGAMGMSQVIDILNSRFGTDFNAADQLFFDQLISEAIHIETLQEVAQANTPVKFGLLFGQFLETLFIERMDQNEEIFARYMNDGNFRDSLAGLLSDEVYQKLATVSYMQHS